MTKGEKIRINSVAAPYLETFDTLGLTVSVKIIKSTDCIYFQIFDEDSEGYKRFQIAGDPLNYSRGFHLLIRWAADRKLISRVLPEEKS